MEKLKGGYRSMSLINLSHLKHYHDIVDLRSYNPYDRKTLVVDLKALKKDPVRSRIETSLYIYILEKYESILEMLIHHLPFILKSQLLEILGYDDIEKSRSNGYKVLGELEDNKLIKTKDYNGSQYVFPSYRSYYYFCINKRAIETKPSERLLNKYFIRAELYIKLFYNILKDNKKARSTYFYNDKRIQINRSAFFGISNIEQNQTKFIANFIEKLSKKGNFDPNNHLSQMLPNSYLINELPQKERALYFALFLQEVINYLKSRCSITVSMTDDGAIYFIVKIIHESNRSWVTYDNLINELNQLFYATELFYYVSVQIHILTFDATDQEEANSIIESIIIRRNKLDILENSEQFYKKSIQFIKNVQVTDLDVSRRILKSNQYVSSRSMPYKKV